MAGLRRPQPGGVGEGNVSKLDAAYRPVERAFDLHERFQSRRDDLRLSQVLVRSRPVINFSAGHWLKPFTRLIEELDGVDQEERRVVIRPHHRRGPRMLELDPALGLLKCHARLCAFGCSDFTRSTAISHCW